MPKRLRCGARWVLGFRKAEKQLAFHFFPPILGLVRVEFTYRGKTVDGAGIAFIKELIAQHPRLSRRGLSTKLCLAWNWVQANGHPRDMVCRGFLLGLHRAGLIELPAKRSSPPNPLARREPPPPLLDRSWEPIESTLRGLGAIEIRQVRRTAQEKLFGSLMQAHHYLGYTQPVGEHLKYVYYARQTPIACMAWSSSPRHLGPRDRFIGWTAEQRRANIHLLAYNTRFLILPWVRVPQLASHLLARTAGVISADWQKFYHHPIYLLETFIDPARFRATCYRAAHWMHLGLTTGRGKDDQSNQANRSLKELWVCSLGHSFREALCHG